MKHPSNKMITDYILEAGSKEELDRVKAHIEICEICSKQIGEILRLYKSSDNSRITLSPELENRILSTYGMTIRKQAAVHSAVEKRKYMPGLLAAAASLVMIFGISFFVYQSNIFRGNPVADTIISSDIQVTDGAAFVNGMKVTETGTLTEGNVIVLDGKSTLTVTRGNSFRLKASADASLSVNESRMKNNISTFSISAQKGVLLSNIDHLQEKITYTISTPHGRIESLGTKFLVEISDEQTAVTLGEGAIRVYCLNNGEFLTGTPGHRYVIGNSITMDNAANSVLASINNFEVPRKVADMPDDRLTEKKEMVVDDKIKGTPPSDSTKSSVNQEKNRYRDEKAIIRDETREIQSEIRKEARKQNSEAKDARKVRSGP